MLNDVTVHLKSVSKLYLLKRCYKICRNNLNSVNSYLLGVLVYNPVTQFSPTLWGDVKCVSENVVCDR